VCLSSYAKIWYRKRRGLNVHDGPWIALIGTLDTKGEEIAYVRDRLRALGARPLVIDTGILGEPQGCEPDIPHAEVAAAAGDDLDGVREAGSRGAAVGVPKLIVTPSASGRREFAPFMGETDTVVMHSVVDILGLHPISRAIFDNAAAAIVGMARDGGGAVGDLGERTVGVTMLGQTTPGVMVLREKLLEAGHAPVIFHANGVGGPAMEKLADVSALAGIIDYTLSELANSLMDGVHATGPDRLRVAGRRGLPQIVVPGCCDFFNQGAPHTVPERFRGRKSYYHNPVATLVRLSAEEGVELGQMIADRLSESTGPVRVIAPTRGFSLADAEGGDLWDPEADRAFLDALRDALRADFAYEEVDAHVDDPAFAELVAERYLSLVREPV
jgi:uncharacterized protein (UPF0261 family)